MVYFNIYRFVFVCAVLLILGNVYLVFIIAKDSFSSDLKQSTIIIKETPPPVNHFSPSRNSTILAQFKISNYLNSVNSGLYYVPPVEHINFEKLFLENKTLKVSNIWKVAAEWVTPESIVPKYVPLLHELLSYLSSSKVVKADVVTKGTQFKLLLTLEGGQTALFKPKWYSKEHIITGSVYAGKDRHYGEIVAFHLGRILGFNRTPVVHLKQLDFVHSIVPVATSALNNTIFKDGNEYCVYGVCLYCKKSDSICTTNGILEGSVILWLPKKWSLKNFRHPWQRSYVQKPTKWELDIDYCEKIKNLSQFSNRNQLTDLIEVSIFDFLIDNGDRHHYEMFNNNLARILILDNGKSFGNPQVDHLDILAPLYQCCKVRKRLLSLLLALKDGKLSSLLSKVLDFHGLNNIILKDHLLALDRRLRTVLATILMCLDQHGDRNVLISD